MNLRMAIAIVGIMLLDQSSKWWIEENMRLGESIAVVSGVFHITHIHNPGAAFGIFPHQQYFFIFSAVLMALVGLWAIKRFSHYGLFFVYGIVGMIAGALGNLIDRVRLSAVVDFLDFRIWPIFNVADIAIVCGAAAIVWALWQDENGEKVEV